MLSPIFRCKSIRYFSFSSCCARSCFLYRAGNHLVAPRGSERSVLGQSYLYIANRMGRTFARRLRRSPLRAVHSLFGILALIRVIVVMIVVRTEPTLAWQAIKNHTGHGSIAILQYLDGTNHGFSRCLAGADDQANSL